jgi:hypothetical protein
MATKIFTTDVKVGMFVSDLDRPWVDTPFLLQGFVIEDDEQIAATQDPLASSVIVRRARYDRRPEYEPPPIAPTVACAKPRVTAAAGPAPAPLDLDRRRRRRGHAGPDAGRRTVEVRSRPRRSGKVPHVIEDVGAPRRPLRACARTATAAIGPTWKGASRQDGVGLTRPLLAASREREGEPRLRAASGSTAMPR